MQACSQLQHSRALCCSCFWPGANVYCISVQERTNFPQRSPVLALVLPLQLWNMNFYLHGADRPLAFKGHVSVFGQVFVETPDERFCLRKTGLTAISAWIRTFRLHANNYCCLVASVHVYPCSCFFFNALLWVCLNWKSGRCWFWSQSNPVGRAIQRFVYNLYSFSL